MRKKRKLPHAQKPFAANGRKLRTLSADIEILNGMWDNVRVGNEPGCLAKETEVVVYVL